MERSIDRLNNERLNASLILTEASPVSYRRTWVLNRSHLEDHGSLGWLCQIVDLRLRHAQTEKIYRLEIALRKRLPI